MAVNVSTLGSVCLYCKSKSDANVEEKEYHEIYDEIGLELQLPTLVETFFHIEIKNDGKKYLCDDCLNGLIEMYDLEEHAKEKRRKASPLEATNTKHIESDNTKNEEISDNTATVILKGANINKEQGGICVKKETKPHTTPVLTNNYKIGVENANIETATENLESLEYKSAENTEDVIDKNKSSQYCPTILQIDDNDAHFSEDDFIILNQNEEESQDLNDSPSNSIIEVTNQSDTESNEHIEYVEEDEDVQDIEINNMVETNSINSTTQSRAKGNRTAAQFCELENETLFNNSNDFMEHDTLYTEDLDATLVDNDENDSQTENKMGLDMEDIYIDEFGDVYYEEESPMNEELNIESASASKKSSSTEEEIQNKSKKDTASNNSSDTEVQFYNIEDMNTGETITVDQNELSNDDFCLEEEYLIEEINCSEEYDTVDLEEYLDKVLVTKFLDLQLNWDVECKLCLDEYHTFEDLLNHLCITEFEEEQQFRCIIKECDEDIKNLTVLARHLILKHYDKLESLSIYGKCPDCEKTFSNIMDFNKHSCCRSIKRKPGSRNYCQYCDMDFQSLKRYVFHMQFHFTNRRPKICLLCGASFKTSNKFFEHTQYQHTPKSSMACIKCDRFFKKKEVFQTHMELHEDSKFQYRCTLCPKKYTNKSGLNQHVNIYHNNKSNVLRCNHCEKEFVNKISYRNHIKCHESDVHLHSFICSTCGIITNKREFIKHHVESDEDSACFTSPIEEKTLGVGYTCENCSLDFHTIKHLKAHRLSESHSDELFYCGICRKSFKSLLHMRNHSTNHKDFKEWQDSFPITRFFVCNIGDCQEFYPIWTTLYYHKRRPHKTEDSISPNKFKCQFCQQLCSSKMSLAVHVARSHNNSNVKCSHCKRSFTSQKHLQQHIDHYHTTIECDICFKKFKNRRNLESHNNMVHLNIKRYFCKHCKKGYFHKSEKDLHEKKVHPDVPYKCDLCNFITNYPESFEIHMDKHNNQLKFQCTICAKEFGRKQLLKSHLKRHLDQKDFSCTDYLKDDGCNARFISHYLLKKHIKSKHPKSKYNIENKKILDKYSDSNQVENISYEVLDSNDDTMSEKSQINDTEFVRNAIELVLENVMILDEQ